MEKEELFLNLGCFGYRDDDFISCAGLDNKILHIKPSINQYNQLMDYLDNCRLFDKPMFDYNGVRHVIFNIKDKFEQITKPIWSEKKFQIIEKFTLDHRRCGLYLKLALEQQITKTEIDKSIFIPSSNFDNQIQHYNNLKIIRSR